MSKECEILTRKTLLQRSKDTVSGLGRKLQGYVDDVTKRCENGEYTVVAFYGGGALVGTRKKEGKSETETNAGNLPKEEKATDIFNQPPEKAT
jgi:hypothetical protein